MNRKCKTPSRGLHNTYQWGLGTNRRDNNNIIRFPIKHKPPVGWVRSCIQCGQHYVLHYQAGAVRTGREKLCVPCWIEGGMYQ